MATRKTKKRRKKKASTRVDKAFLARYCNLVPDPIDPRDRAYGVAGLPLGAMRLPKRVDYGMETGPVGDQGHTGSCVGWATAYGLRRWLHFKQTGMRRNFSVRFVWMGSKEYDPFDMNVAFDLAGTRIRDAFKVMRKFGACRDTLWPFSASLPIPDRERAIKLNAMQFRIGNYCNLSSNAARRAHLAKAGPFVVGVPVYSNWPGSGQPGDAIIPDPGGVARGGHAVLVVGYDDDKKLFRFQNSWGRNWGKRGYGFFTYDYMEHVSWSSWGADRL